MPISSNTTPVVLQALAQAFRKCSRDNDRYTTVVTSNAHSTAVAADSVAVNMPDRMPPRMMKITSRPGRAAARLRATSCQPAKLPRVGEPRLRSEEHPAELQTHSDRV